MADDREDAGANVRAVTRAIDILKCFEGETQSLSVTDIRHKVPLSRPTLYRLLDTLVTGQMLHVEGEPQRYRLGRTIAVLCRSWSAALEVDAAAKPILEGLRDSTGESCALFELRGERQFCIVEARSRHALAMTRGVGEMTDGFHGASGIAILAWRPLDEALRIAAGATSAGVPPITEVDLRATRRNGYAVSHGAIFKGAASIAAPVFDQTGEVFGSLGAFGPSARMTEHLDETIVLVRAAAAALSARLGAPDRR